MNTWLLVIGIILVLGLSFVFYRRQKKRKKQIHKSGEKHSTGYLKYHSETETRVKKAFHPAKDSAASKAIAVIHFKGDLRASANHQLSHLIDEVILNVDKISELVVHVDSPGGSVMDYGHSFALIERARTAGMQLTVCVDVVAASGGYLMSLPAHKILAGPFAMVGSIGVVSFIPNIRKLLEKYDVEPRTFTAGDYKRTITMTDNATPEQAEHYQQTLQLIHDQFKSMIAKYRPQVDLARAATGEAWLAQNSMDLKLGLVDQIISSSEYLLRANQENDLVFFTEKTPKSLVAQLLSNFLHMLMEQRALH